MMRVRVKPDPKNWPTNWRWDVQQCLNGEWVSALGRIGDVSGHALTKARALRKGHRAADRLCAKQARDAFRRKLIVAATVTETHECGS